MAMDTLTVSIIESQATMTQHRHPGHKTATTLSLCSISLCVILAWSSVAQAQRPLYISEFMASNAAIQGPDGDYDDWIELHNATNLPVDVGGWYLTDDLTVPNRWQFPANRADLTTIAPLGYLVVWADNDVNHSTHENDAELERHEPGQWSRG